MPYNNFQFSIFNFQLKRSGFSLIEILVALGIIGLLGIVAMPNLKNFSKTQEIEAAASQLVNTLKAAQSAAAARSKCPKDETSNGWVVRLTSNNYSLIARCQNTPTPTEEIVFTYPYSPSPQDTKNIFTTSVKDGSGGIICAGQATNIIFVKNRVYYSCSGSTTTFIGNVNVTLTNSSGNLTKIVKIEQGGVIKVE